MLYVMSNRLLNFLKGKLFFANMHALSGPSFEIDLLCQRVAALFKGS